MLVNTDLLSSPTQHCLHRRRAALQLPFSSPRVSAAPSPYLLLKTKFYLPKSKCSPARNCSSIPTQKGSSIQTPAQLTLCTGLKEEKTLSNSHLTYQIASLPGFEGAFFLVCFYINYPVPTSPLLDGL